MSELFIILGLIILNGLFSMSEMALVSTRKSRLETRKKQGDKAAAKTLKFLEDPEKFLSTVQIGVTLISILTGIFSGAKIHDYLQNILNRYPMTAPVSGALSTFIILLIVTYFTLVLGELVPKRIGMSNPEKISMRIMPLMKFVSKVAFPFIWLLTRSTNFVIKLFRIKDSNDKVTEDDIISMVDEGTRQGEIASVEQDFIEKVLDLGDRSISSIMTHRNEIKWIDLRMSKEEIIILTRTYLHTVYPVCEGGLDNIKGIVRIKDVYVSGKPDRLHELIRPTLFVPPNVSVYKVMQRLQRRKMNVCFVVDEYGEIEGMVTLKDIFEEIVGDVEGENDIENEIIKVSENEYLAEARVPFYDFLDFFDRTDQYDLVERVDTLSGFVLSRLGHFPVIGEEFRWDKFTFEIYSVEGTYIDKVLVKVGALPGAGS